MVPVECCRKEVMISTPGFYLHRQAKEWSQGLLENFFSEQGLPRQYFEACDFIDINKH